MSVGELRAPAAVAWAFFVPGLIFMIVTFVRLQVDGLTLIGVVFLLCWAYLLGGFTREFWVTDISQAHPDALGSLDLREREGQR